MCLEGSRAWHVLSAVSSCQPGKVMAWIETQIIREVWCAAAFTADADPCTNGQVAMTVVPAVGSRAESCTQGEGRYLAI